MIIGKKESTDHLSIAYAILSAHLQLIEIKYWTFPYIAVQTHFIYFSSTYQSVRLKAIFSSETNFNKIRIFTREKFADVYERNKKAENDLFLKKFTLFP